jgi:hypothetical protein
MTNVVVFSRMDQELKRALAVQAKRERRSLSNLIVGAAEFYLRQHGSVVTPDALVAAAPVSVSGKTAETAPNAAPVARLPAASSTGRRAARKK